MHQKTQRRCSNPSVSVITCHSNAFEENWSNTTSGMEEAMEAVLGEAGREANALAERIELAGPIKGIAASVITKQML